LQASFQISADDFTAIIEGGALGGDRLARQFARLRGVTVETFPAEWATHGLAAGPIRSKRMLVEGRPDLVVAFPGGPGTTNMVRQARAAGVLVIEVEG
jgi:YspA, cpYpsA-related SLOG family